MLPLPSRLESSVQDSIRYLNSEEALQSIENDPYWPKWNSPWWHFSVLYEMGLAHLIPRAAAEKMLASVKRTHLPYFFKHEAPAEKKEDQEAPCACGLGNIYQILSVVGLNVDAELPWAREWFIKYQASDGGLSCDEEAYQEKNASSMVGTIACLEAVLLAPGPASPAEINFLDRGAQFLLNRELRLGSKSMQNAEEREDEEDWLKLCFPRFYLYDVLRGLNFILAWAKVRNQQIPAHSIKRVIEAIETQCKNGDVFVGRRSFEGIASRAGGFGFTAGKRAPASHFTLLDKVSLVGSASSHLTLQWVQAQKSLNELKKRDRMI